MIREEILNLVEKMTVEELVIFRDEIEARLHNREVGKVPPVEDDPEE